MVTLKQLTSPYVSFGVYLVIILIGIALSMAVFSSVKRVKNNTIQLKLVK